MCTVSAQSVTLPGEGGAEEAGETWTGTRSPPGGGAPTKSLPGPTSGAPPEAEAASRGGTGLAASQPLSRHWRGTAWQCIATTSNDCSELCVMRGASWRIPIALRSMQH